MPTEVRGEREWFGTMARQKEAAELGMWVFLATEMLLFGGLFVSYTYYRWSYPDAFHLAGGHVKAWLGLIMTLILVTADLLASLAVGFLRKGNRLATAALLLAAAVFGLAFLGLHLYEYWDSANEGALPGEWFRIRELAMPGASLFFTLFWIMTGLHMLHVTVGVGVLLTLSAHTLMLKYDREYRNPVEVGTMYWHFVDLVWTFLFPLLYLMR